MLNCFTILEVPYSVSLGLQTLTNFVPTSHSSYQISVFDLPNGTSVPVTGHSRLLFIFPLEGINVSRVTIMIHPLFDQWRTPPTLLLLRNSCLSKLILLAHSYYVSFQFPSVHYLILKVQPSESFFLLFYSSLVL